MIRIDQSSSISPRRSRKHPAADYSGRSTRRGDQRTPAEGIDEKLKAALRRARSLMFCSPVWLVEFETDES